MEPANVLPFFYLGRRDSPLDVTLELEGIDRKYLNVYVPKLQYSG